MDAEQLRLAARALLDAASRIEAETMCVVPRRLVDALRAALAAPEGCDVDRGIDYARLAALDGITLHKGGEFFPKRTAIVSDDVYDVLIAAFPSNRAAHPARTPEQGGEVAGG